LAAHSLKSFEEVWSDIKTNLKDDKRKQVQTICKKVVNDIVEIGDLGICVISERSKSHKRRFISKEEFAYVWPLLSSQGVPTLEPLTKIIGKRAVTCAIFAKLTYVKGTCDNNHVSLTLNETG
jgi:hypothetical protein